MTGLKYVGLKQISENQILDTWNLILLLRKQKDCKSNEIIVCALRPLPITGAEIQSSIQHRDPSVNEPPSALYPMANISFCLNMFPCYQDVPWNF